jgi:hypothetical protein
MFIFDEPVKVEKGDRLIGSFKCGKSDYHRELDVHVELKLDNELIVNQSFRVR